MSIIVSKKGLRPPLSIRPDGKGLDMSEQSFPPPRTLAVELFVQEYVDDVNLFRAVNAVGSVLGSSGDRLGTAFLVHPYNLVHGNSDAHFKAVDGSRYVVTATSVIKRSSAFCDENMQNLQRGAMPVVAAAPLTILFDDGTRCAVEHMAWNDSIALLRLGDKVNRHPIFIRSPPRPMGGGEHMVVIGYNDPTDRTVDSKIRDGIFRFDTNPNEKRVAVGKWVHPTIEKTEEGGHIVYHDATLLRGTAGAPLYSPYRGQAVGIQLRGEFLKHNVALTGGTAVSMLPFLAASMKNTTAAAVTVPVHWYTTHSNRMEEMLTAHPLIAMFFMTPEQMKDKRCWKCTNAIITFTFTGNLLAAGSNDVLYTAFKAWVDRFSQNPLFGDRDGQWLFAISGMFVNPVGAADPASEDPNYTRYDVSLSKWRLRTAEEDSMYDRYQK